MILVSLDFLVFSALFFIGWPLFRKNANLRLLFIVFASFVFYGWTDIRNISFLGGLVLFSFLWGRLLSRANEQSRLLLWIGIFLIIGILTVYRQPDILDEFLKLYQFTHESEPEWLRTANRYMPLGISFIALHCISFFVDSKNGQIKSTGSFLQFTAYLSFFPKLIAGPIERYNDLVPQLLKNDGASNADLWVGFKLIAQGYFYKTVLADHLAPQVIKAFNADVILQNSLYWWIIITAFAMQIYFDFRGYSDIARGLGQWMGIKLNKNFGHPYSVSSVGDFWSRWHISFSTWLRTYVFFPIARSKTNLSNPYIAVWITMLLSGIWHGMGWTFVAWGATMALFISIERTSSWPSKLDTSQIGRIASSFITLLQIWVAWVFFRSIDLGQAFTILKTQFSFSSQITFFLPYQFWAFLLLAIGVELLQITNLKGKVNSLSPIAMRNAENIAIILIIVVNVLFHAPTNEFIYFQF